VSHDIRNERGFTLLELMIAAVILSVGLLALADAVSRQFRWSIRAAARADLGELADAKLEELRLAGTVAVADSMQLTLGGSTTTSVANHADTVPNAQGINHVRRWSVVAGPVAWSRAVTVRVQPIAGGFTANEAAERTSLIVLMR
jgi:prepilin-type N-terminal cleavage/methylation domain-containing protein